MDCVDCHNRPTHQFRSAAYEVDAALTAGQIDASLPFVKREALKAITATYPEPRRPPARASRLPSPSFYEKEYPQVWSAKKDAVRPPPRPGGGLGPQRLAAA